MRDKSQADKFKAAAKQAECDTDTSAFDAALKKIAKNPKQDSKAKPAPKNKD